VMRRLRDESGLTIMLSSHLLHEVEQICNRIVIVDRGRLIYQGSLEELTGKSKTIKVKVDRVEEAFALLTRDPALAVTRNGDDSLYVKLNDDEIPQVHALLLEHGLPVWELPPRRAS